jgi:hypothetical protein
MAQLLVNIGRISPVKQTSGKFAMFATCEQEVNHEKIVMSIKKERDK